jgi:pimeloyl-ACP methyl ester carboxylesterase
LGGLVSLNSTCLMVLLNRNLNENMKRIGRMVVTGLIIILFIVLVGPFLIPIPLLKDTVPPEQLADPDSNFVEINGLNVHYKTVGQGEPVFVLLHGFGASVFSWREVMAPLSELGTVIAYDRPAFGLTERPLQWRGENPYGTEAQIKLLLGSLDHFGFDKVVLVGNSAGGTVALQFTRRYPERVEALVLVDAAVYVGEGGPTWLKPLLNTPQFRHLGPLIARRIQSWGPGMLKTAWHDPARITPEIQSGYKKPLQADNWDRALWELTLSTQTLNLAEHLNEIRLPALVITGDDDRIVPTAQSIRLAGELPDANLVVIPNCGHVPQEEKPVEFMQAVKDFLKNLN